MSIQNLVSSGFTVTGDLDLSRMATELNYDVDEKETVVVVLTAAESRRSGSIDLLQMPELQNNWLNLELTFDEEGYSIKESDMVILSLQPIDPTDNLLTSNNINATVAAFDLNDNSLIIYLYTIESTPIVSVGNQYKLFWWFINT